MLTGVAQMGDVQTVKDLLALGAPIRIGPILTLADSPFAFLREQGTALERAAHRGAFDIVRALLDASNSWSKEALDSAYVSALSFGDLQMARELVAHGSDPRTARGYSNRTPLMAAAESGLPAAVEEALKVTADVNELDRDRFAALHWAAGADYLKTVDSVHADRPRVIEMLLRAGAQVDQRGYHEWTPLISNWMGFPDVTAAFIRHGASVNAQDEDGRTPLMANSSAAAVELLLKAGADPCRRDSQGRSLGISSSGMPIRFTCLVFESTTVNS
jgi:ankyrin repeat protein